MTLADAFALAADRRARLPCAGLRRCRLRRPKASTGHAAAARARTQRSPAVDRPQACCRAARPPSPMTRTAARSGSSTTGSRAIPPPRFDPATGLPVCDGAYPPGTVLGDYETRDAVPRHPAESGSAARTRGTLSVPAGIVRGPGLPRPVALRRPICHEICIIPHNSLCRQRVSLARLHVTGGTTSPAAPCRRSRPWASAR